MPFLNRRRKLSFLDERFARNRAEIAILCGRQRVGKSVLLYHLSADKPRFFFGARRESETEALTRFAHELHVAQGNPAQSMPRFANWAAAFEHVCCSRLTDCWKEIDQCKTPLVNAA